MSETQRAEVTSSAHRLVHFACRALLVLLVGATAASAQTASTPAGPDNYPNRTIRSIVPYPPGGFNDTLARIVSQTDALESNGYCVLLGNSAGSIDQEEAIVRILLGHRPAGFVIQGANHTSATRQLLRKANIPVVEMDTLPAEPIEAAVGYSNEAAAREMTRYLIAKGHRSIGFVSAPPDSNDRAAARLRGYSTALHEASIVPDPRLIREARFDIREGRILLDYFIGLPSRQRSSARRIYGRSA
jgi:LacI family transcriptional regulator, gluconate utilization system Gnt-I transcriptional repressor